jgi:hypothetical protein
MYLPVVVLPVSKPSDAGEGLTERALRVRRKVFVFAWAGLRGEGRGNPFLVRFVSPPSSLLTESRRSYAFSLYTSA